MKHYSILFWILLILLLGACGKTAKEDIESDLTKRGLKGPVKKITENKYLAVEKFGEISPGEIIYYPDAKIVEYNKDGFKSRVYDFELWTDSSYLDYELTYTPAFKLASQTYFHNGEKDKVTSYEYDEDENLIWEKDRHSDTTWQEFDESIEHIYNDSGKVKEINTYDENGKLHYKCKYDYDNAGRLKTRICYNSEGKQTGTTVFGYHENGVLKIEEYKDAEEIRLSRYDTTGNELEEMEISLNSNHNDTVSHSTYQYDKDNNLIKHEKFYKGKHKHTSHYKYTDDKWHEAETVEYDFHENPLYKKITRYDEDEKITYREIITYLKPKGKIKEKYTYKYHYDDYGNWTKRIKSSFGNPSTIVIRKIEYYES